MFFHVAVELCGVEPIAGVVWLLETLQISSMMMLTVISVAVYHIALLARGKF